MSKNKRGSDAYKAEAGKINKKAEGLLKKTTEGGEEGYKKAARFLMLMGKEEASNVLKHLSSEEVEKIAREIALIKNIDPQEAERILMDFDMKKDRDFPVKGGVDSARSMLVGAFGEEKGNSILKKVVPYGGEQPFSFLNEYEVEQLYMLLKDESDYVLSVILSYLEPKKASSLLTRMDPEKQKEIVHKIAKLEKVDSEVLERMETILREKIRTQGKVITEEVDGTSVLAGILKHMKSGEGSKILEDLDHYNHDVSSKVKEKLFTIEDIISLSDRDMQNVLRDYDDEEISIVLKGKSEEFRQKLLSNISERRKTLINEIDEMKPRKKSEVEDATTEFLRYIKAMIDKGEIQPPTDEGDYVS